MSREYKDFLHLASSTINLKYCPECYTEQKLQYGEAYFVRYHFHSNVNYCYKHHIPLLDYNKKFSYRKFHDINSMNLCEDFEIDAKLTAYSEYYINLANFYKDILNGQLNDFGIDKLIASYNFMLESKGFKHGNKININRLCEAFENFYEKEYLESINCNIKVWLEHVFNQNSCYRGNLIKHFLVMNFLYGDASNLTNCNPNKYEQNKKSKLVNIILTSSKRKNSLLKELHCSLNVAYQLSKEYGIEEVFLEKMKGYFDEANINRCKARIEEYANSCNGKINMTLLAHSLTGEYKIVVAAEKEWINSLIHNKEHGRN